MSTVMEDLKRLEDRVLARVEELESSVAQLDQLREVGQLGVNRTSLYPVVRQLVSDGLLHKDGRGLWPVSP